MSLDDRNAELEKKLEVNPVDEQIAALVRGSNRQRQQIIAIALSLLFDLILSVLLAFGWSQNHRLATQAESNRTAIIRRCETTNASRANNKVLWDYLLSVPPTEPRTPEQQQRVDAFAVKVNETFAPDDCSKVVEDTK